MRKLLYIILFIGALYNSSAKGEWGKALDYPYGGTEQDWHELLAYGDSTFIFHGEYIRMTPTRGEIYYFIRYTLDGGKTWKKLTEFEEKGTFLGEKMKSYDLRFSSLNFFPPSTLQFTQYSTANVFRSTDWGATWTKTAPGIIKNPVGEFGVRTYALDSLRQIFNSYDYGFTEEDVHVWAGKSYMTFDGWKTWDSVNLPKKCVDAQMVDDSNLVSMFWPNIYYSSNRGKTWDSVAIPGIKNDSIYRMYGGDLCIVPNSNTILFTGTRLHLKSGDGNIITWKSSDAGRTWRIVLDTKDSLSFGGGIMSFNDKGEGLIVSQNGCFDTTRFGGWNVSYISSDYGETWERVSSIAGAWGTSFSCVCGSLKNMWVLIDYTLYKYKPEPSGVIEIPNLPLASSGDVYPNPVGRGKTVYLPFNEGIAAGTSVKIYSLLGELIDEYIPEESTKLLSYRPDEKLVRGNYYFLIENLNQRIIKSFVVE